MSEETVRPVVPVNRQPVEEMSERELLEETVVNLRHAVDMFVQLSQALESSPVAKMLMRG